MEIPFLKNKQKYAGGGTAEIKREGNSDAKLLGMVTDELLTAYEKKDRAALKQALHAFILMINQEGEAPDA